jgi:hypothetical protein
MACKNYSDTEVSSYSSTPEEDVSDTSSCADKCISDSETEETQLSLERTDNVCKIILKSGTRKGQQCNRINCKIHKTKASN